MFSTSDTIVAIATPHGRGGVGMVRLSGPDAERIGQALIGREDPLEPRRATFARVVAPVTGSSPGPEGPGLQPPATRILDQAVVTFFPGPNSYTGEDVVEISGHGSPLLLRRIVELAMTAGARLAEPGEFTLRAYLNERIDLVQAEAVADLIEAVTPLQARVAMDQLEGTLTGALARIDADLFDLTARLEASLDFPDEGFHFITREQLQQEIWRTGRDISALTSQGRAGRVVREGRIVAILGRPNAGKSSLFNALVGAARAIVTDIPGTTRDMLSERVDIDGMAVTLVDTAGLREAGDAIEAEGVARARQAQQVAALSLVIVDGAAPLAAEDRRLAGADPARTLVVVSKSDLPAAWPRHEIGDRALEISALTGAGLAELRRRLGVALTGREELRDPPCISNARHLALLDEARRSVDRAAEALASGATEELILVDLGAARRALEEITGRRSPDDLLAHIFSRFCVGK